MKLSVVHLPTSMEEAPYILVFSGMDAETAQGMNDAVKRFPEVSGGACHGVVAVATDELTIEVVR